MRIRSLLAVGCGILLGLPSAWGILPPARQELPNFDQRTPAPQDFAASAGQQQAVTRLQQEAPGAEVTRDNLLGLARWVKAPRGFLTAPSATAAATSAGFASTGGANEPQRIIKGFLDNHPDLFGYDSQILTGARVTRDYVTEHNGLHTVVWEQTVDDIPVFDALLSAHVTRSGQLVSVSSGFIPGADQAATAGTPDRASAVAQPLISAAAAVVQAAANLGATLDPADLQQLAAPTGAEKQQRFTAPQLRRQTSLKLVWLPMSRTDLRLCWRVVVSVSNHAEMYLLVVDARTGEVLVRRCLTTYATPTTYTVYTSDSPSPFSPGWPVPNSGQPSLVQRSNVTLVALSTNASPNGWVYTNNYVTTGNNVDAYVDALGKDSPSEPRPAATNRAFTFPLDLTQNPPTYSQAAAVQLFYLNNWMHDQLYLLGFTEAAGNYQSDNFGRGGLGGDPVVAEAQDGGGVNNANFSAPPDGEPGWMQMYIFDGPTPQRDGDLDADVVLHEYTHGLSGRLVGAGVGISELQSAGMGEGWSDFYALSLLSSPADDPHACYPEGGYVTFMLGGLTQNYYYGIRRYPYSTDMTKNPLTLKDIDPTQADPHPGVPVSPIMGGTPADEVHAQGEVWCVALWDARAALVDKLGGAEGNRLMLQLTTDAMKLCPPNPTFLESRDAIIEADDVLTGGDNYNELWIAFAGRGYGFSAKVPPSDTTIGVVEAYDLPKDVIITPPDGILEVRVTPGDRGVLFAGTATPIFVRVSDGPGVTNATISAKLSTGGTLNFRNDGVSPDRTANNAIYSATFNVPSVGDSVTLTLVISAPSKVTSTNVVTYSLVALPTNDNFTNAIKVPPTGSTYVSDNTRATMEPGEPAHAGDATAAASLWWIWSSPTATNVLVDTSGSLFDSVIGVYTNSQLTNLQAVASADNVGTRKQAYLTFPAAAGVTYHIAIASASSNSTGGLYLRVQPGGQPDITPPTVAITSPPSGFVSGTNQVVVRGTATDPSPNASGIDQIRITVTANGVPSVQTLPWSTASDIIQSTNWAATVALTPGVNSIQVSATDVAGNVSATASIEVTYILRDPLNDFFVNATPLVGTNGTASSNTRNATKEVGEPLHAGNAGGKSVWWTWQAPADGVLTLITTNSTFDTLLAVYTGTRVDALTAVVSNDDALPQSGYSKVAFAVRGGDTYRIAVDGFDGASGVAYLYYEFVPSGVFMLTINTTPGGSVTPPSGPEPAGAMVLLTALPDPGFDFVGWEGGLVSSTNPLSVMISGDLTLTARFAAHQYTDGFESGDFSALHWTTDGSVPWLVQTNVVAAGRFAARSGAISNLQSSSLKLALNSTGGFGAFDFRVSSETNWDLLEFYVNGRLQDASSGDTGWLTYRFAMPVGVVNLEWRYVKDATRTEGLDAAFLDNVDLPLATNTVFLANQTLRGFRVQLQGLAGQQVRVQRSPDLHHWSDVTTLAPVNGVVDFVDPAPPPGPVRFYRALTQ